MPTQIRWRPPVSLSPAEQTVARKLKRIGKFYVFGAAVQARMWVLAAVAAANSVIAAFYYLNVVRYMFLVPAEEDAGPIHIAAPLGGALAATGVLTLLLGLLPSSLIAWASASANTLLAPLR